MAELRAHLLERPAANPFGLRLRLRQDDLVQRHCVTQAYHARAPAWQYRSLDFHHHRDHDGASPRLLEDRFGEARADVLLDVADVADPLDAALGEDRAELRLEIAEHVARVGEIGDAE